MLFLIVGLVVIIFGLFLIVVISASLETSVYEKKPWWQIFPSEFWSDFKLIVESIFHASGKDKKLQFLKNMEQIGLYLIEVFAVCGLFLVLTEVLNPVNINNMQRYCYEQIIRFITFYTAYQFLVFSLLNLTSSSKKDSWLATLRIIKLTKLYLYSHDSRVKEELDYRIKDALYPYTFMEEKPIYMVKEINEILKRNKVTEQDKVFLDLCEIKASHYLESVSFFWRFSFLLNYIKEKGGAER